MPNTATPNRLIRQRGTDCPGYRGGFSYISKSLPRNNHHFTKKQDTKTFLTSKRSLFNDLKRVSRFDNYMTPSLEREDEKLINIQNTPIYDQEMRRSRSRSNQDMKTTRDDYV